MSSNNADEASVAANPSERSRTRVPWSLAARLTIWYAGSAFLLILAVVAFLDWMLARSLDRENDNQITDQVRVLHDLMEERPGDLEAVRQEAEQEFQSRQHTQVYIRLLDGAGKVLVETPGMAQLLPPTQFPPPLPARKRPDTGKNSVQQGEQRRSADGRPLRVMSVEMDPPQRGSIPNGSTIQVVQAAMDRSSEAELLAEYRSNLGLVLAAGLIVCIIVGHQIAYRGLQPVRLVADTARRIDTTNFGERIDSTGLPGDLLDLAVTFNRMLDRLERSFTRLNQFSADIAHELRTPVNNLRGEIEVALGKRRAPERYEELLASNLEDCDRLTRLIESLLFLAKAENPRTQFVKEVIDVGQELATVCEFYEAAANEKKLTLAAIAPKKITAALSRTLFQRAVCNLVENAMTHTPQGGTVTLSAAQTESAVSVIVADTGSGIPAEHLPHVFDRFYRADQVRSSVARNIGLGLSIVKGIVDLHGGDIRVASQKGQGTRVTMSFPK